MNTMLLTVLLFAVINFAIKAAGPVLLHGRALPARAAAFVNALPPALLAGLFTGAVVGDAGRGLDPTLLAGLATAAAACLLRAGQLGSVVLGVLATAALRHFA